MILIIFPRALDIEELSPVYLFWFLLTTTHIYLNQAKLFWCQCLILKKILKKRKERTELNHFLRFTAACVGFSEQLLNICFFLIAS